MKQPFSAEMKYFNVASAAARQAQKMPVRSILIVSIVAISLPAYASTLIQVRPPSGCVGARVVAINDKNSIAGICLTSDEVTHGFVGPLGGPYTIFDDSDGGTAVTGMDNKGAIVGFEPADTCSVRTNCLEFERTPSGKFTTITKDGKPLVGYSGGITNSKNEFVGSYHDGTMKGYIGRKGLYAADIVLQAQDNTGTFPFAINDSGDIAGFFTHVKGATAFLLHNGVEEDFDFPSNDAVGTYIWGLNAGGKLAGSWMDSANNGHPFVFDSVTDTFTEIQIAQSAFAKGINSAGLTAIFTATGPSYIYCPLKKKKCPADGADVRETKLHISPHRFFLAPDPAP